MGNESSGMVGEFGPLEAGPTGPAHLWQGKHHHGHLSLTPRCPFSCLSETYISLDIQKARRAPECSLGSWWGGDSAPR